MNVSASRPEISIVAPMYNEEGNVLPFVEAVEHALAPATDRFEIVLVDDGSSDRTWNHILEVGRSHPRLRGVRLARNFGHQGALLAGLSDAYGKAVVSMDGDLQHPPALIPSMIEAWQSGYKVVNTRRTDAEDTSLFKRTSSRLFYFLFSKLTGVDMARGSSDYRLLDAAAVRALCDMNDVDVFIRGQVSWLGFHSLTLAYQAQRRHSGSTKYSLAKMFRFASGAVLSFSVLPLRLGIWAGFLTSAFAAVELCYIIYRYLQGFTVPGWASVMTFSSLMFAVLFVLLGIIGTYLGKIYEISKHRPRFLIGERFPAEPDASR